MHRKSILFALTALFTIILGCRSHEAKVADLQEQYDQLGAQFRKDCSGEMVNLPQKLSPKCADESKQVTDAWNRLQAERTKKL